MPEASITLADVEMVFRTGRVSVRALGRVSLEFLPGEVSVVMGPSGSGKTTLLSLIGCLLTPTSGSVGLLGADTSSLSGRARAEFRRRNIGFVFQSFRLFRALSALENVLVAVEIAGGTGRAARRRAIDALSEVGLTDKAALFPDQMSGGEKQRVAIARAVISDAPILLADEPTAALDASSGASIASLLAELAHVGRRTVVVVSHDERLARFADRRITLVDGRIDTTEELDRE